MASKKELVESILKIKKVDTKPNLMKKSVKDLESILDSLDELSEEDNTTVATPQIDMAQLMAQMKAELMAELKEEARKEVLAEIESENVEPEPVEEVKPRRKTQIDRFEPIPVMSVSVGELTYASKKTGVEVTWGNYGDIEYIEFQEIQTMKSSQRRFIDFPFVVILDEEVVNYLGLDKEYAKFDKEQVKSLDYVFRLPQAKFGEAVKNLPKGIQQSVVLRARQLHSDGTLDSIKKLRFINETFGTDIGQRGE